MCIYIYIYRHAEGRFEAQRGSNGMLSWRARSLADATVSFHNFKSQKFKSSVSS